MKYSFDGDGPTQKIVQYYEMMGTRALWHDGWHVVAQRAPQQGGNAADFANDTWELYHSDDDRAEIHDLAAEHPDMVKELVNLWYVEAGKYDVLPLDNRSIAELLRDMPVADVPEGGVYRYYPQTSPVPEFARPRSAAGRSRSWPRSSSSRTPRACSSPTARGSAATRCSSRTASSGTSTTSSDPAEAAARLAGRADAGRARARRGVREGDRRRARRGARHRDALRRRPRRREERVEDAARSLRALR